MHLPVALKGHVRNTSRSGYLSQSAFTGHSLIVHPSHSPLKQGRIYTQGHAFDIVSSHMFTYETHVLTIGMLF